MRDVLFQGLHGSLLDHGDEKGHRKRREAVAEEELNPEAAGQPAQLPQEGALQLQVRAGEVLHRPLQRVDGLLAGAGADQEEDGDPEGGGCREPVHFRTE